jgi:hypothetical protein
MARLRLWVNGQGPDGRDLAPSEVVVEWAGRTGHPTSYALLGGLRRADQSTVSTPAEGAVFANALAGRNDTVIFGLPGPYRDTVALVLGDSPDRIVVVTTAAHGLVGSSQMAFRRVAGFLATLLDLDAVAASDVELWDAWDRSVAEATR